MLTESASRERKWGSFPALRQVLEVTPSSTRHIGLTSVSDNVFEQLQRLVDIADRAEEHKEVLLQAVRERPELRAQMAEDLRQLQSGLDALRHAFDREIESLSSLCDELHGLRT